MHVFDLGLFQNHCRQVWGINVSTLGGDGKTVTVDVPRPPDSDLEKWYETIRAVQDPERLREKLSGNDCTRDILWHICNDHDLRRAGTKWQLAGTIVEWVS